MEIKDIATLLDEMEYGPGDCVDIQPGKPGGHREDSDENMLGKVTNLRVDNSVCQYLVDLFDGGHYWVDAQHIVDAKRTSEVYGHLASDGKAFVSFEIGYHYPELAGTESVTEAVEGAWFSTWDDDSPQNFDAGLEAEPDRKNSAPQVGTISLDLTAREYEVEIFDPEEVLG